MIVIMIMKPRGLLANREPSILLNKKMNNILEINHLTMKFGG